MEVSKNGGTPNGLVYGKILTGKPHIFHGKSHGFL